MATNTATAAAVLVWVFAEWVTRRKPTVLGAAIGAVAGLVAITPATGFVGPISSIIIGIGAGIFCYAACNLRAKLRYDDSLDVVGVHGIGGTQGTLATGLFTSKLINPAGADGLFFGNPGQLKVQALAVLATWVFAFFGTLIILSILKVIMGLRVSGKKELEGINISQHGEVAYSGFQMISSLGSSEMKALEEEIEELEKRKERILTRMSPTGIGRRIYHESSPPPKQREKSEVVEEEADYRANSPFRIVVENVNREELRKWWEDMCYERVSDRPNEFNDIFKQLKKFHDGSFLFRKGDPDEIRRKLQIVLRRFNPKFGIEVEEE
ncbi:MAG: hypothetical protein A2V51_00035 [Candidatus Dadabacteria bacterium RBG_19FT_COMBO_40_33]|nr:MAG: hypothetical protein A2V51_00035 [Candidatus Dadabacteria bacterium RBG_19FT_COMBO_40_33]